MKRYAFFLMTLTHLSLSSGSVGAEVPNVFQTGQLASAEQINENFAYLSQRGGKSEPISVDCSAGPNAVTQALASATAREVTVSIVGTCIEDHLKVHPHTSVLISGHDGASVQADVIEVNFSSLTLEVPAAAGTLYVSRGLLFSDAQFRSKAKGAAAQAFLDGTPTRGPQNRMFAIGNGYIYLSNYGCLDALNDNGFILSYNHARIDLGMKESCGSSLLSAGTRSKISVQRDPGVNLSSKGVTVVRGELDGSSIFLGSPEFAVSQDGAGEETQVSTGVPPENINVVLRNMNINLQNVCLSAPAFLTTVVGHIEPSSTCTDSFVGRLTLNNGSHITSKAVLRGDAAPLVSASSSYSASTYADGRPNFICDDCAVPE